MTEKPVFMKIFRNFRGHPSGQTMTVGELRKKLEDYKDDTPVFAEWEGCRAYIDATCFGLEQVSKGHDSKPCLSLVIDVNCY